MPFRKVILHIQYQEFICFCLQLQIKHAVTQAEIQQLKRKVRTSYDLFRVAILDDKR